MKIASPVTSGSHNHKGQTTPSQSSCIFSTFFTVTPIGTKVQLTFKETTNISIATARLTHTQPSNADT